MLYFNSLTAAGVIRREEGSFIEFVGKEDSRLLIELLYILKDVY